MERRLGDAVNAFIVALGLLLVFTGFFFRLPESLKESYPYLAENIKTILVSVGASVIATAIVSLVTARYLLKTEATKEIIKDWGLLGLYETKAADMNKVSNQILKECKRHIDILTIGMTNYRVNQGSVLIERLKAGAAIRIISCNPRQDFIRQRKRDENPSGWCEITDGICEEVEGLTKWVDAIKKDVPAADIKIRYLNTYPAFSYLRLDDAVFFSANLYMKPSQYNMAAGYMKNGKGFKILSEYFEELWENENLLTGSSESGTCKEVIVSSTRNNS